MATLAALRLLDAEPDLGRFLSNDERIEARNLMVPVRRIPKGRFDVRATLEEASAFGAVVLEGMLFQRMGVGDHVACRLLGPGDVISLSGQSPSMLFSYTDCRVGAPVRLALLGREILVAARRWPGLLAGLHVHVAEQSERLAAQLVICQLPRVEQRVHAIMWLLAESWGQVTSVGTSLPVHLTHDALGGLVGARRSTVTLALGELADRGALIRQDRGWLLLGAPPSPTLPPADVEEPQLVDGAASSWGAQGNGAATIGTEERAELLETVRRLRAEHLRNRELVRARLERLRNERKRTIELRTQLNLRSAPS